MSQTYRTDSPVLNLLELGVERPADARVVVATVAAAGMTDLAVRSGVAVIAGAVLVVVVAAGLAATRRVANPQALGLLGAAVAFGACLAVRTSPWLIPFDVLAVGGLLVLAASLGRGGSLFDLTVPAVVARALHALAHGIAAPGFLVGAVGRHRQAAGTALAVLRGLALAVPLLIVLGLLLASADAVFAGFFGGWSPETVVVHAVLLTIGAWGMAGLLRVASASPAPAPFVLAFRLGRLEATIVLGSLVALFAAFATAQLIALSGGGRHVLETAGLTYAEYARTGFFQLIAVATITLGALLGLRSLTDLDDVATRRRFVLLGEAAVALTLVVVFVALRRLDLYQDAFGLTMLRLYSQVFAAWMGGVFVLLAAVIAGAGPGRSWLPATAAATGLAALLALNVANPEAMVVRHNVDFAASSGRFDPVYLAGLSDDAVPALAEALPRFQPEARARVLATICAARPAPRGFWGYNGGVDGAVEARNRVCR